MIHRCLYSLCFGATLFVNGGVVAETSEVMRDAAEEVPSCATSEVNSPEASARHCHAGAIDHFDIVVVAGVRPRDPVITLSAAELEPDEKETLRELLERIGPTKPIADTELSERRGFQTEDEAVLFEAITLDGFTIAIDPEQVDEILDRLPARLVDRVEILRTGASESSRRGRQINIVLRDQLTAGSGSVRGSLSRIADGRFRADLRGGALIALDTPLASYRAGLDLRIRGRDRVRTEQNNRFSVVGEPLSLQSVSEVRSGEQISSSLRLTRDRSTGQRMQLLLEAEREKTVEEDAAAVRTSARQSASTDRLSALAEYSSADDRPRRLDVTLLAEASTEDRRFQDHLANPQDDGVTDRLFVADEERLFGRMRFAIYPNGRERFRLEFDIDRQARRTEITQAGIDFSPGGVDAEELRLEPGISYRRRLNGDMTALIRLELETNRLETRTEGLSRSSWFTDFKPTLNLSGSQADDDWRLWLTRSVTQISLEDFTTNFDEIDMELQSGNPGIRPQKSWEIGAAVSRPLTRMDGRLELSAEFSEIEDLIDFVTGPDKTTLKGNIGDGRVFSISSEMDMGLESVGLGDGRISLSYDFQDSSVFDPNLGNRRAFSETPRHRLSLAYERALPGLGADLSLRARSQSRLLSVETDRIDEETQSAPEMDMTLEWRLPTSERISLTLGNLFDTQDIRERTRFRGSVASGEVQRLEERVRQEGRFVSIDLRRSF